jgi:hypothetical protein
VALFTLDSLARNERCDRLLDTIKASVVITIGSTRGAEPCEPQIGRDLFSSVRHPTYSFQGYHLFQIHIAGGNWSPPWEGCSSSLTPSSKSCIMSFDGDDLNRISVANILQDDHQRVERAPSERQKLRSFTVICLILNRTIGEYYVFKLLHNNAHLL